jgi:ribose transport system permease protein
MPSVLTKPRAPARATLAVAGRSLLERQEAAVLLALVALIALFVAMEPDNFGTSSNARNLAQNASISVILVVGVTYVTVMGAFDLSIGAVLVLTQVLAVKTMGAVEPESAGAAWIGLAVALTSGAGCGLVNGMLVARLGLSPFIVTLATAGAAFGASQLITGGADATTVPPGVSEMFAFDRFLGLSYMVWLAGAIAIAGGLALSRTRYGLRTYAVGSNPGAARRAGVKVDRHIASIYVLMGVLAGLAGYVSAAYLGSTSINSHSSDALNAITAVALGGASLYGGVGSVLGSVIGVSIPAVLQNGLVIADTNPYWNQIFIAGALVLAIYLDRRRRLRAAQPNR